MRAIDVEATAVADKVVLIRRRLRDVVDHIKAKTVDALVLPKAHDIGALATHLGVCPVEVSLRGIVEVHAPLAHGRLPLPGRAAKLRDPVARELVGRAVAKQVVVLIALLASQSTLIPLVLGRCVVKDHVEHDPNSASVGLARELLEIGHGAIAWVHGAVIGHVIAVVALRRGKKRGEPDVVHAQLGQIVELARDTWQISPAVAV